MGLCGSKAATGDDTKGKKTHEASQPPPKHLPNSRPGSRPSLNNIAEPDEAKKPPKEAASARDVKLEEAKEKDVLKVSVFDRLDDDGSGHVDKLEVIAWIRDERLAENEMFSNHRELEGLAQEVMALDQDGDGMINFQELSDFLEALPVRHLKALTSTLIAEREALRNTALRKVFDALDINGDGLVNRQEIYTWVRNESSWLHIQEAWDPDSEMTFQQRQTQLVQYIDENANDDITFDELSAFFDKWDYRHLRHIADDQLYMKSLHEYLQAPTPALRARISVARRDRSYLRQIGEKHGDSAVIAALEAKRNAVDRPVILVIGATGKTGREVVRALCESKEFQDGNIVVHAAVHGDNIHDERALELVAHGALLRSLELDDEKSVASVLEGVQRVYLVVPPSPHVARWSKTVVDTAVAGETVKFIVLLSGLDSRLDSPTAIQIAHAKADACLRASGIPCCIIVSSFFFDHIAKAMHGVKRGLGISGSTGGDASVSYIATRDVGDVIAKALLTPSDFAGKEYTLTGPVALSDLQVAALISEHIGQEVKYTDLPAAGYKLVLEEMFANTSNEEERDFMINELLDIEAIKRGGEVMSAISQDVEKLLGRPPTTFAQWALTNKYFQKKPTSQSE